MHVSMYFLRTCCDPVKPFEAAAETPPKTPLPNKANHTTRISRSYTPLAGLMSPRESSSACR